MQLVERESFISFLETKFERVAGNEGHTMLICGEAGIGKTSLVNTFCRQYKNDAVIFQGSCDALTTPRPLAPVYDIASQLRHDLWGNHEHNDDRAALFTAVLQELEQQKKPVLIVFEDIHWADEATLDFIKFLARRIKRIRCLFILTYRDNEINARHPLRSLLGQLPPDTFTRMQLVPLSRPAVEKMAMEKGYNGEDVYSISGGNPFYVSEILASYSPGVPDNIRDSILSVYYQQPEKTKQVWELIAIVPGGFECEYLAKMEPLYTDAISDSLESKILIINQGLIFFKHELYRRAIESSLSPLRRVSLNKKILDRFLESFKYKNENERILHHAKGANEYELIAQYTLLSARHAATLGAHIEASKLYLSAIENYRGTNKRQLIELYELYAYECYLTSKNKDAILYIEKSLKLWQEQNDQENIGNCLRFLSRLWWFEGKTELAHSYALQAIELLQNQPSSKAKAMAYSNLSRLKMSEDLADECLYWGELGVVIAREVDDQETISTSLNNMGSALMLSGSTLQKGVDFIYQSLDIALKNSYHEFAARAYTSLLTIGVSIKEYEIARKALNEGLLYCEEKDIDSQKTYMLAYQARLDLETGNWNEAYTVAEELLRNDDLLPILKSCTLPVFATLKMRKGHQDALTILLEAKKLAFETKELQRIIPTIFALLEYEWITGESYLETELITYAINWLVGLGKFSKKSRFYFWLWKAGKEHLIPDGQYDDLDKENLTTAEKQTELWEKWTCPYEQALALAEQGEECKKKALLTIKELGADAVYEKMKREMREAGIKNIPRGIRNTTRSNLAHLTDREVDVLRLLKEGLQNKEIAERLFISAKTVDHHISSILLKLEVKSRVKAVNEAIQLEII